MQTLTICYCIAWTICREYGLGYAEIGDQTCRGFSSSRTHSPTGLTGQTIVGDPRETQEAAVPVQQLQLCPAGRGRAALQSRHGDAAQEPAGHCPPSAQWQLPLQTRGCQGRLWCGVSQRISVTCDTSPKEQDRVQEIRSVPELISCLYFMRSWISGEHSMKELAELQSWRRTDVSAALLGSASSARSLCTGKICQTGLYHAEQFAVSFTFPTVVLSALWTSLSYQYLAFNLNLMCCMMHRFHDIILPVPFSCY